MNLYEYHIIKDILNDNSFGIMEVNQLVSLYYGPYITEEYRLIENLLCSADISAIKALVPGNQDTGEYLDLMSFTDQDGAQYLIAVNDSIALERDPVVKKIFKVLKRP